MLQYTCVCLKANLILFKGGKRQLMKKSLILTVAAATLLAVSCGKGSGGQKSWDKDAKAFMMQHLGEVLPYAAFDADSFSFEPDVDYYPEDGVVYGEFYVSDDNDKDIFSNYGKSLEKAGWTLEVPNESRSSGEEYYYKETKNGAEAYVSFAYVVPEEGDNFNPGNVLYCEFVYEPQLLESVSFDEAEKLYSDNKIKIDLPELVKAPEEDPEVRLAEGEGEGEGEEPEATGFVKLVSYGRGSVTYDIYGVELADFEAFGAQMEDAGWTIEDYYGDLRCAYGETLARAYLQDYTDFDGSVRFEFYVLDTKISFADVVSAYKDEGINVTIPDLTGEGFTYDISGPNYMVDGISDEEIDAWAASLNTAGWNLAQDSYGDYAGRFGKTLATLEVESFWGMWYISFGLAEPAVWPAEEIAADLAAQECTDPLPAFEGEALSFSYVASQTAHQVVMQVGAGNEEAAIASYATTLKTAGFTEAGVDTYGDMHYLSPNGQYDVCAWDGNTAGTPKPGYVFVDIAFPKKAGFINKAIKDMYAANGIEGVTLPDFTSFEDDFVTESSADNGYQFYLSGDHVEAILTLLEPLFNIPETPSATYGYECIYKTNSYIEFDVMSLTSGGSTYTKVTAYYATWNA